MKFEKRAAAGETPDTAPETDSSSGSGKKPVIIYIMILFLAAFVLMFLSLLAHQRSNTEALGELQNSVAAMQAAQEQIIDLQTQLDETEQERDQAKAELEAAQKAQEEAEAAAAVAAIESSATSSSYDNGSSYSGGSSSYNNSKPQTVTGNTVVDRAYGEIGKPYVWGGVGPDGYDCSGFVSYCLTGSHSRLGTTGTFMGWTRVSDPQPGDVCVNSYHTGIYIGGGQMIHAATYGIGVVVGSVQSDMIYVRY